MKYRQAFRINKPYKETTLKERTHARKILMKDASGKYDIKSFKWHLQEGFNIHTGPWVGIAITIEGNKV